MTRARGDRIGRSLAIVPANGIPIYSPVWDNPVWAADQAQFNREEFNREDLKRHSDAVAEVIRRQIVERPTDRNAARITMVEELLKRRPDIGGTRTLEPIVERDSLFLRRMLRIQFDIEQTKANNQLG